MNETITVWTSLKGKADPQYATVGDWLNLIKSTPEPYLSHIQAARSVAKGSDEYEFHKSKLPVAQLNGCFPDRKISSMTSLTGYAYLDTDECEDMDLVANTLKQSPYVYSYWKSVSGLGFGILVKYELDPTIQFNDLLVEIAQELEIVLDKHAKGLNRNNFLSHDPDLYINPNVKSFVTKKVVTSINKERNSVYTCDHFFRATQSKSQALRFEVQLDHYPTPVVIEPRTYFKAFWPWASRSKPKKLTKGERNSVMTSFINNLRLLNPDNKDAAETIVYSYNRNYCLPPLSSADVKKMIEYRYSRTDLQPVRPRTKKYWVDPAYKGNKSKAIGIARKLESINKIEDFLSEAFCQDQKITIKRISASTKLSESTVRRHLENYKEEINQFNKFIIETRPKVQRSRKSA